MKRLLSLFDYSGKWGEPFAANGWDVIAWDIKTADFMDINLLDSCETVLDMFEDVHGILSAPPCTDFTVSGAQYWSKKDANGTTQKSLELVYQVQRLVDLFRPTDPDYDEVFFWALENPAGRISKLTDIGQPYYFNPCDFALHLPLTTDDHNWLNEIRQKDGHFVTNEENEHVLKCNAYNKKTGIWGEFNRNLRKARVEPVKTSPQGTFTQRLGGKSDRTKELRSNTPEGFALAFYEANFNHTININS